MHYLDDLPVVLPLNIVKNKATVPTDLNSGVTLESNSVDDTTSLSVNPSDNAPVKDLAIPATKDLSSMNISRYPGSVSNQNLDATPPSKEPSGTRVSPSGRSEDSYAEHAAEATVALPTTPVRSSTFSTDSRLKNSGDPTSTRFVNKVRTFPRMAKTMFKNRENKTSPTPAQRVLKKKAPNSPPPPVSKSPSPKSPLVNMAMKCPTGLDAVSIGPIIQCEFFNFIEPMMHQALDAFLTDHRNLISTTSFQEEVRLWSQPILGRGRGHVIGFAFPLIAQGRIIKANISALKPVLGNAGHDVASTVKAWLKIIDVMVNGRTLATPDWLLLTICQTCGKMLECIGDIYYNVHVAQKWTNRITTAIMSGDLVENRSRGYGEKTEKHEKREYRSVSPAASVESNSHYDSDVSLGSDYEEAYAERVKAEKDLLRALGIMGDSEAFGGNFDRVNLDTRSLAIQVEEVEEMTEDGKPPRPSFERCMDYW